MEPKMRLLSIVFSFFIFSSLTLINKIFAFPDTIRHGYTNCTTCHVSPSGGGLLTSYGRSLSRELISTWGYEDEEQPLHGLMKIPESLAETVFVGGDIRSLSLNETKKVTKDGETKTENESEYFLMQTQLRLGLGIDQFKFIGSLGKIEDPMDERKVRLVSTEYYALWSPKEEFFARVGRFEPIFGLRMSDHNIWIKSETNFVPWAERDTAEIIFEGEKQFLSVSGFQSTSLNPTPQTTGYSLSFYQILGDKQRIGFSGMNQEGQGFRSRDASLHGVFSFSESFYLLTENTRHTVLDKVQDIYFLRLGYDLFKGFTGTLQAQAIQDKDSSDQNKTKNGVGITWYPRPHFELVTNFDIEKTKTETENSTTFLFHYYL